MNAFSARSETNVYGSPPPGTTVRLVLPINAARGAEYSLTIALFLRALGVVYCIAFVSLAAQMLGLYGSQGILPIADLMARQTFGVASVWALPTLFWLNTADWFLLAVPLAGALLSLFLVAGFHARVIRFLLYVLYLSLVAAGQDFMAYQWDSLLLKVGLIAIFLGDANLVIWLYRWLLFRLMLLSGLVKILSGDPAWRNLTALDYHFLTQPLPNVFGFYAYALPGWAHQGMVAATFVIELVVPFLVFAPRRLRFVAGALIALLQVQIFLTGNYNFFNLLVLALCILLLDDAALQTVLQRVKFAGFIKQLTRNDAGKPSRFARRFAECIAVVLFLLGLFQLLALFRLPIPGVVRAVSDFVAPLRIVNFYGPFAVMTTTRNEIVIEGSRDGETWLAYEFKYKPGDVRRAPPFVAPHQPRLDWQMWFAALNVRTGDPDSFLPVLRSNPAQLFHLQSYDADAWFVNLLVRLLQGSPQVLALLDKNPFPDTPPRFVRARLYNYHFAEMSAPFTRGEWWTRNERGLYFPALSLGAAPVQ